MKSRKDQKLYKIIILGESYVGKTSIARRYVNDEFDDSLFATIGIDLLKKMVKVGEEDVKLDIWDTAGQERFHSITKSYYRSADGIFLVFDLLDLKSFNCIDRWFEGIKNEVTDNVPIFLIGNKYDQAQEMNDFSIEQFERKAQESNVQFFVTSAKTGHNIENVFYQMAEACIKYARPQDYDSDSIQIDMNPKKSKKKWKKCC